jgi:cysteine-rich repeat protein
MTVVLAGVASLLPATVWAQASTTPGTPTAPHPTLENLSIVWPITGDSDNDSVVTVRYRAMGAATYRTGLPLRRIPAGESEGFSWVNKHAGSVFDLVPGTTYEIELSLSDPDGGSMVAMLTATTRPEPTIPAAARMVAVTTSNFSSSLSAAMPGDVLVLASGSYGGFTVSRNGTASMPIVIKSQTQGGAIVTGQVRLDGRSYVWLDGLTIRERVRLDDSQGIVVRNCTINTPGWGISAYGDGTADSYICDNSITGPNTGWVDASLGAEGDNMGEGIELTGPGNVICYNFVRGFRDNISTLEDDEVNDQQSIDIYGNDLQLGMDDCIEADFTQGNTRVMRNRMTNCFVGISGQPTLGGPAYSIRNVMYNIIYSPFKLHRGSVGDIAFHNTVVKCGDALGIYAGATWSQAMFRNNIFIGGSGGGTYGGYGNGSGQVAVMRDADDTCTFDYDGYGTIGVSNFRGQIGDSSFSSLATLKSATTEKSAIQVDLSVFAASVQHPSSPFPERMAPDLRLAAGSAGIDKGVALPGVNDGFAGAAPDLGAYELGSTPPHYGPRTAGVAPVCGNGAREGSEQCDDGNVTSGDGCSASCAVEATPTGTAGTSGAGTAGTSGTGTGGRGGAGTGSAGTIGTAGRGGSGSATGAAGQATGVAGSGTPTGVGGDGTPTGSGGTTGAGARDVTGGCGCNVPSGGGGAAAGMWLVAAALVLARKRRARR